MLAMPKQLIEAIFIARINRFAAQVQVGDKVVLAHVPSSGRMWELLVPGALVYVSPNKGPKNRTACKLLLVQYGEMMVSIDSLLPNRLLNNAFKQGEISGFEQYTAVHREFFYGQSRLDFLLARNGNKCLVEVKSVTLVENGVARFPDAPSSRGARHLEELIFAVGDGFRAAVIFVVQRGDGRCFQPHHERDPLFGAALQRAHGAGVEIYALGCRVGLDAVSLAGDLPVILA